MRWTAEKQTGHRHILNVAMFVEKNSKQTVGLSSNSSPLKNGRFAAGIVMPNSLLNPQCFHPGLTDECVVLANFRLVAREADCFVPRGIHRTSCKPRVIHASNHAETVLGLSNVISQSCAIENCSNCAVHLFRTDASPYSREPST